MIYGVLIRKGERYYSYLRKLFSALNNMQVQYKWLLSNYECYPQDSDLKEMLAGRYLVLDGEQLTDLVNKEDVQWIWGIFCGVDPAISDEELLASLPSQQDAFKGYEHLPLAMAHPRSKIEIVAVDSSYTMILTKEFSILETLKKSYPCAEDLAVVIADCTNT